MLPCRGRSRSTEATIGQKSLDPNRRIVACRDNRQRLDRPGPVPIEPREVCLSRHDGVASAIPDWLHTLEIRVFHNLVTFDYPRLSGVD